MGSLWLDIELLDDAAITRSSATVGGHESLRYIPGATLLGAVARRAYPKDDPDRAFRIFHCGAVRFGNGLPLASDGKTISVPMPLGLHKHKVPEPGRETVHYNLARGREQARQYTQAREGFVTAGGELVEPEVSSSMRTAVDAHGRARDGFLFDIEAIRRGTRFRARIDAEHDEDLAFVAEHLVDREISLGRSRSAEFGRAKVTRAPEAESRTAADDELIGAALFLCISDLALRDPETGQPSLRPTAATFGLAGWTWNANQSFLRTRVYSPFNSHRRRPDLERQVIVAGSVIVFDQGANAAPANRAAVRAAIERGIGEYRAEGMGQLELEPGILLNATVDLCKPTPSSTAAVEDTPADSRGELAAWIEDQVRDRRAHDDAWETATAWLRALKDAKAALPPAQWGDVRAFARRNGPASAEQLSKELRTFLVEPPSRDEKRRSIRHGEQRWGKRLRFEGGSKKIGEWLADQVQKLKDGVSPARVLEIVATRAPRAQRSQRREQRS
jgi:hypothetical protein